MRIVFALLAVLLVLPAVSAEKIPFEYTVGYKDAFANWDFSGFGGAEFDGVPVFFVGVPMNFQVNITSNRDFKDVMVIVVQEYYCKTVGRGCATPILDRMDGDSVITKFYDKIEMGETVTIDGSVVSYDDFSSLDRTHLIIMHCPDRYCEKHMDKFWEHYNHNYYNHLNNTVAENLQWKYFKWGKILLDDPFAGIWCPVGSV